jgi:hypothetical protein
MTGPTIREAQEWVVRASRDKSERNEPVGIAIRLTGLTKGAAYEINKEVLEFALNRPSWGR